MNPESELNAVTYRSSPDLERFDTTVEYDPGVQIFVRSIVDPDATDYRAPVLLLHGARASSVPSFDLDVPGGSLAADLARAGHPVYLMDARGYGGSSRPDAMSGPPEAIEPLTRSPEVVRDISAAVEHVRQLHEVEQVALMGWATGSQWLAHFAATEPDKVSHLILYNAVWPARGGWAIGDGLADPDHPDTLKPGAIAGYGFATADSLRSRWDASIPTVNPDEWRDPAVVNAYLQASLASDPTSSERDPASIRTPLGAFADTFDLSRGKCIFDPSTITARVLVLRSERDFWSRSIDFNAPLEDLVSAASVARRVIPDATHFAHLDREEHGRRFLLECVRGFLARS